MSHIRMTRGQINESPLLEQTLDRLRIEEGEEFVIAPASAYRPPSNTPSRARARKSDPQTSHKAAASVARINILRTSQREVREVLRDHSGGLTDEELVEKYHQAAMVKMVSRQSPSGVRTRRAELVDRGDVVDTGERRTLVSGREGIVWGAVR